MIVVSVRSVWVRVDQQQHVIINNIVKQVIINNIVEQVHSALDQQDIEIKVEKDEKVSKEIKF